MNEEDVERCDSCGERYEPAGDEYDEGWAELGLCDRCQDARQRAAEDAVAAYTYERRDR